MKKGVGEGVLNLFEEEVWRKGLGREGGSRKKTGVSLTQPSLFFNIPGLDIPKSQSVHSLTSPFPDELWISAHKQDVKVWFLGFWQGCYNAGFAAQGQRKCFARTFRKQSWRNINPTKSDRFSPWGQIECDNCKYGLRCYHLYTEKWIFWFLNAAKRVEIRYYHMSWSQIHQEPPEFWSLLYKIQLDTFPYLKKNKII